MSAIPSWVPEAHVERLNGHSAHKSAPRLKFNVPGDGCAGAVVFNRTAEPTPANPNGAALSVVRVEAGQSNGVALEPGAWVEIAWTTKDLRAFYDRLRPDAGDSIVVTFDGEAESAFGQPRKLFSVGYETRGEASATTKGEGESRW